MTKWINAVHACPNFINSNNNTALGNNRIYEQVHDETHSSMRDIVSLSPSISGPPTLLVHVRKLIEMSELQTQTEFAEKALPTRKYVPACPQF